MNQLEAILSISTDLTSSLSAKDRYQRLLRVVQNLLKCDAATLMKKERNSLRLLAAESLSRETLQPVYLLKEHPRLEIICQSKAPVLFPADSPLPDPFDSFLERQARDHNHGVHSCLGCPLIVGNELVGVLTADSLRPGAFDHLDPSFLTTLGALAGAALQTSQLLERLEQTAEKERLVARELMRSVSESAGPLILGSSAAMEKLREEIYFAAQSDLTVLITGETGVGKELVARSIQARSRRKDHPMIYVNCAALPENLIESELFGHVKGAFTGAEAARAGKFEIADGGTILLDEIGEMPLAVQAKLLRVLQEGELQRVGSDRMRKVNVRVIAATNRDLQAAIMQGRFRADLFYRLNVYPIRVPSLKDHREDLPFLVNHFCELNQRKLNIPSIQVSRDALAILKAYPWPGNIRELRNILDRTILKAKFRGAENSALEIRPADLPSDIRNEVQGTEPADHSLQAVEAVNSRPLSLREATREYQRQLILHEVRKTGGNWAAAAKRLGLFRSNLFALAKRLGIKSAPTPPRSAGPSWEA